MRNVTAEQAASLLRSKDRILILTHLNPDGDTLGSGFALLHALQHLGKTARVVCGDKIPPKYDYMRRDLQGEADFQEAFVVAVDIADTKLLGARLEAAYGERVDLCIDHHLSNTKYADALFLEECAATCELIYRVITAMGVEITPVIADCIYTGLSTDTGCFRYSNVTPETLELAADMLRSGANFDDINRVMFETKTKTYLKLEALVLDSLELLFGGRCALVTITQEMFRQSGSNETECDGIASLPRKIEGVSVGLTLREREDGSFKVSVRTYAPYDASAICAKMGGGGHARAAGCEIEAGALKTGKDRLLDAVRTELETQ